MQYGQDPGEDDKQTDVTLWQFCKSNVASVVWVASLTLQVKKLDVEVLGGRKYM